MKRWLQACRVNSLAISSIGVFVGTALAVHDGYFDALRFLLAWLGSVTIQAGTNLTNVYYNYKATSVSADPGAFDPRSSAAVLRLGLLTPTEVRSGGLLLFGVGIVCGLVLTWLCGWTILWLGLPAIAAGYFYAGPPIRYGHVAMGVVAVFIFMGPVMVGGAYFVHAVHFSASSLAASISIGLVAAGIMHINDLRDYDTDVEHGKQYTYDSAGKKAGWIRARGHGRLGFCCHLGRRHCEGPALAVVAGSDRTTASFCATSARVRPARPEAVTSGMVERRKTPHAIRYLLDRRDSG